MAGRDPKEALDQFIRPLRKAVHTVTEAPLVLQQNLKGKPPEVDHPYLMWLGDGVALGLRGPHSISLEVKHQFRIVHNPDAPEDARYRVTTVTYLYYVSVNNGKELLAYHWDPAAKAPKRDYPHLHVGSVASGGSTFLPGRFNKAHLPTGRISLEAVLIGLLEEFGVLPVAGVTKTNAIKALKESQEDFFRNRTTH